MYEHVPLLHALHQTKIVNVNIRLWFKSPRRNFITN